MGSFTITVASFPDVVTVTPRPTNTDGSPTTNVPTEIYLELGFSQTMDRPSVENSTLTLSQLTDTRANSGTVVAETEFNLPLSSDWITPKWHDSPRGIDTLLKVTVTSNVPSSPFSLTPATTYLVQMYDNQAKAEATNLPLFLGGGPGGGSFDGINLQAKKKER